MRRSVANARASSTPPIATSSVVPSASRMRPPTSESTCRARAGILPRTSDTERSGDAGSPGSTCHIPVLYDAMKFWSTGPCGAQAALRRLHGRSSAQAVAASGTQRRQASPPEKARATRIAGSTRKSIVRTYVASAMRTPRAISRRSSGRRPAQRSTIRQARRSATPGTSDITWFEKCLYAGFSHSAADRENASQVPTRGLARTKSSATPATPNRLTNRLSAKKSKPRQAIKGARSTDIPGGRIVNGWPRYE